MASPTKVPSMCRGYSQAHYARFLPNAFLGVALAFPLGIFTASIEAISLFGSILPISILFGLIFPIIIPLITVSGVLLASWHLASFAMGIFTGIGRTVVASVTSAKQLALTSQAVHILSHAHEIGYMGIYGMLVILNAKPLALEPEVTSTPPLSSIRLHSHTHLFIHDFPKISIPVFPPTPLDSDATYTPSRSPTSSDSTDTSFSLRTPPDDLSNTSLAMLSGLLDTLKDEELSIVANYVEVLKRGRSSSYVECASPLLTDFPQ